MNERYFSTDESAHQNLVGVGDRPKDLVDVMAFRMRPPAALDVLADDSFRKARRSPLGRGEDDAMLSDECQRFRTSGTRRHDALYIESSDSACRYE